MKKLRFLLCLIILCLVCSFPVCARNEISVYVNGIKLICDVPPVIENDRTLVPLRAIAESVNLNVDWEESSQKVTLSSASDKLILHINNPSALKNNTKLLLDVPPKIINGRTMVPLRFIGESLGFNVSWYENTGTVTLYSDIAKENALSVYILNVGQADSIFVHFPDGRTMLVDGGNPRDAEYILDFLHKNDVEKLDFLVATHPHSDHIGGLPEIIAELGAEKYYMPKISHNTLVYEKTLQAIKNRNGKITTAKKGVVIAEGSANNVNFSAEIVAPCSADYAELNDYSAVILLSYGKKRILLTGDAETISENQITADIDSDVLKVGHHGSETSTGEQFLKKVTPSAAIISVGKNNSYGLPDSSVLDRLEKYGCTVYRTDENGTVTVITDGSLLAVYPEKGYASPFTDANRTELIFYRTKTGGKYHYAHCSTIAKSKNLIEITISQAITQNIEPCSICNPPAKNT